MRIITQSEKLKITTMSIIYSMPEIFRLSFAIFLIIWIFAIFFLNFFKGKFYSCNFSNDSKKFIQIDKLQNMYDCFNYGGRWENSKLNFDNIYESIFSLVVIFLRGGYMHLMNSSADSVDIGYIP